MDQDLPPLPQRCLLLESTVFPLSKSLVSPKSAVSYLWEHLIKTNIYVLDNRFRADQLFVIFILIYYSSSFANSLSYAEHRLGLITLILSNGEWRNATFLSAHINIFSNCLLSSTLLAKTTHFPVSVSVSTAVLQKSIERYQYPF